MRLEVTVRRPNGQVETARMNVSSNKSLAELTAKIIVDTAAAGRGEVLEVTEVKTYAEVARRRTWLMDNATDLNWLGNKRNQY